SGGSDCDDADALVTLGTPSCPAVSCKDLLARYPATYQDDGAYTIKPYASAAFSAWCDMTTAGGGGTMLTNPVETGPAEVPGLQEPPPSVSGAIDGPTTWSPSITSLGEYVLRNYSCGAATVTWNLVLPDAFGARDVMWVSSLQG